MMTAWFGTNHPGEGCTCSACGAQPGKPCTFTLRTLGTGVDATSVAMTGMHKERVQLAQRAETVA